MPYNPLLPPSNSIQVYKNVNLTESMTQKARHRLYCGYADNTNETTALQNVWEKFPYPSSGFTTYRNNGFTIDGTVSRITYNGSESNWFDITATCNVLKGTGANQTRTIEFQWFLNGNPFGTPRQFQMNSDANIITGNGEVYLSQGDYIEPMIRNIENDDKARLYNCSFNIREDYDYVWRL